MFFFNRMAHQARVLKHYLGEEDARKALRLLRQKAAGLTYESFDLGEDFHLDMTYPQLVLLREHYEAQRDVQSLNRLLREAAALEAYDRVLPQSIQLIARRIAPFTPTSEGKEFLAGALLAGNVSVLIIADDTLGMHEYPAYSVMLRHHAILVDIPEGRRQPLHLQKPVEDADESRHVYWQYRDGLVGMQHADRLPKKERENLKLALREGFFYDGRKKLPTSVQIIAHALPIGNRFVGKTLDVLSRQIPLSQEVLTSFHAVIISRADKAKREERKRVTLRKDEYVFLRGLIEHVHAKRVYMSKRWGEQLITIQKELEERRTNKLLSMHDQFMIGLVRLAKMHAKINHREEVMEEDIRYARQQYARLLGVIPVE